jgi:hypothetical protein
MNSDKGVNKSLCMEGDSLVLPMSCNVGTTDCSTCCEQQCGSDNKQACLEACNPTSFTADSLGANVYVNKCNYVYTNPDTQKDCCVYNCNNDEQCIQECLQSADYFNDLIKNYVTVGIGNSYDCYDCTDPDTINLFGSRENCCKFSNCPICANGCKPDYDNKCVVDKSKSPREQEIITNWCENNVKCKDNNTKWLKTFYDNLKQTLQVPDEQGLIPNDDMVTCYVNSLAQFYPNPSTIPTEFPEILLSQINECKINPEVDPGQPQLYFDKPANFSSSKSKDKSSGQSIGDWFNKNKKSVVIYLIIIVIILLLSILLYKNRDKIKNMFNRQSTSSYNPSIRETINKMN